MNLIELGAATDSEYDQEHSCNENTYPKADRFVHCIASQDESKDAWQMHSIHYADEYEVEMGEADYVDEITYHSMIVVNYCPFCGINLKQSS
ncbi:MAG: hypothetical protein WCY88_13095 [Spongiibacteraceae bacterium]